ncbi:MAG: alpha-L-arabinofuranosidase, partial [Planctomycetota bacterium]
HSGEKALEVTSAPDGLDVTASRTGGRVFLHVVNTSRTRPVEAELAVDGVKIGSGEVFEIAAPPEFEVFEAGNVLAPKRKDLPGAARWTFPPASVSAVELHVAK